MFQLNGDKEARTPDPCNAIAVLYQLSYDPKLVPNLLDRVSGCQEINQFVLINVQRLSSTILATHQQGMPLQIDC
jgi:hypothetical protein